LSNTDFFNIITAFNWATLPLVGITWVLGVLCYYLPSRKTVYSNQLVSLILAYVWSVAGIVFGLIYFRSFVPVIFGFPFVWFGYTIAAVFTLQGLILLYFGVFQKALSFKNKTGLSYVIGTILMTYAIGLYQLIAMVSGHSPVSYPAFGTAPGPVAVFTIGLLLWADKRIPSIVLILPSIFGITGILSVLALGVYADIGLFISGVIGFFLVFRHHRMKTTHDTD